MSPTRSSARRRPKSQPEIAPEPQVTPSAPALAQQFADDIRTAQLEAGRVTAAQARADVEIREATRAREEALDAQVLKRPDADEQFSAATARLLGAQRERADLEEQAASALRVVRSAQERLRQLRVACLPEFVDDCEEAVAEAAQAATELREPLERYLAAYGRAADRWKPLIPAIRGQVEREEAQRGFYRSGDTVTKDCQPPSCPIDPVVLGHLATVLPRPPALADGFDSNPFKSEVPDSAGELDVGPRPLDPDGRPLMFESDRT